MIDSIVRFPWTYEYARLLAAYHQVNNRANWSLNNQMSLTHCEDERDFTPFDQARGRATEPSRQNGEIVYRDSIFDLFNPEFRDTFFSHVWEDMQHRIPGGVCRMRLMKLSYKGCLSFHEDFCVRYHIPIITNPRAFFFVNESGRFPIPADDIRLEALASYHLPADGSVFKVDTTQHHTVYNGGRDDRIHLVFSSKEMING